MDQWNRLLVEFPIVVFDFVVWPCEILIGLPEVKSWHEECKNTNDEWHQKSESFFSDKDSKVLFLCVEEGCTDSRDIEKHWNTNLNEALNDTVFLLLQLRYIIGVKSTGIKGIAESVHQNNENDGHGSNPIHVINSLLHVGVRRFHRLVLRGRVLIQSLDVSIATFSLKAAIRAGLG